MHPFPILQNSWNPLLLAILLSDWNARYKQEYETKNGVQLSLKTTNTFFNNIYVSTQSIFISLSNEHKQSPFCVEDLHF